MTDVLFKSNHGVESVLDIDLINDLEELYDTFFEQEKIDPDGELALAIRETGLMADSYDEDELPRDFVSHRDGSIDWGEWRSFRDEHGDIEEKMAYIEAFGSWSESHYSNCRYGRYSDFSDFVQEYFLECNEVPDHLMDYLDWESIAADYEHDFVYESGYVFCNN